MDTSEHPTEGGTYTRDKGGALEKVSATKPAPPPVNRASPDDPHPEPETPPAAAHDEEQ